MKDNRKEVCWFSWWCLLPAFWKIFMEEGRYLLFFRSKKHTHSRNFPKAEQHSEREREKISKDETYSKEERPGLMYRLRPQR